MSIFAWGPSARVGRSVCPRAGLAALALFLVGALAGTSQAQEVTWTHAQIANVNGAMPSIEVDRLGYVHVGWTLNLGGSSYYAYHAGNQSGAYAHTLVDSRTSGSPSPYFPYLATDGLGFFHMVWRELSLTGKPVFYRTNNPETRALVKMSFASSGHTHDPLVDVTADNIAHVVTEADSCTGCPSGSNLFDESFATNTTYAGRVTSLAQDLNDATGVQQYASVVAPDGSRHMVFSMRLAPPADNQRLIYYSMRAAGSLIWTTPVSLTGHQDNYQGWPAIVADAAGVLHVVYSAEDYGVYYVHNRTGIWSTPVRINDQNAVVDAIPSIAVDPSGRLHVVFQRYTPVAGQSARVSLHYTTNAYDADNWLDPASEVLTTVDTFTLTHQNRKLAVNWVDGQVLVPYMTANSIWLASTTDVPVTPPDPGGTSTLAMTAGFAPPASINRTTSNTAATATSVLKFRITDNGTDAHDTRISEIHVNAGGLQSYTTVSNKGEGLSYLLGGAQVVTGSGQVITALVSDTKMVFRDVNHNLWVGNSSTQTYDLQLFMKNQAYVTGKTIELRIKPDQDVVTDRAGSVMVTDQPVIGTDGIAVVDNNATCPTGQSCNDGDPCTFNDLCNNSNVCVGSAVTCNNTNPCTTSTCNGTASCTVTPKTGQTCSDGNACTHTDVCSAAGVCGGTAISCASDACNTRSCNGSASCTVTPIVGGSCGGTGGAGGSGGSGGTGGATGTGGSGGVVGTGGAGGVVGTGGAAGTGGAVGTGGAGGVVGTGGVVGSGGAVGTGGAAGAIAGSGGAGGAIPMGGAGGGDPDAGAGDAATGGAGGEPTGGAGGSSATGGSSGSGTGGSVGGGTGGAGGAKKSSGGGCAVTGAETQGGPLSVAGLSVLFLLIVARRRRADR